MEVFQSTLSVRRATFLRFERDESDRISIHALRKESDKQRCSFLFPFLISIHALRKESDVVRIHVPVSKAISIHALRKESDSRHQNRPQ